MKSHVIPEVYSRNWRVESVFKRRYGTIPFIVFVGIALAAPAAAQDFTSPITYEIRNDDWGCGRYGCPRDGGKRMHGGIDLKVKPGASVVAPADGVISTGYAYEGDKRYHVIRIDTADGYRFKLMYAGKLESIPANTAVKRGDIIGFAEDIRNRYGPTMLAHLHVEVYYKGVQLNPENIFAEAIK